MELFNYIFRLGVIFAIFGFMWGIFEILVNMISPRMNRTLNETYFIKLVKYVLLVAITFLFCGEIKNGDLSLYNVSITATILLVYFIGKLQNQQNRMAMFSNIGQNNPMQNMVGKFDVRYEIGIITISILCFIGFIFYPQIATNPVALWFRESIVGIENTPLIGFIFKFIGFLFLLGLLMKMFNGFAFLVSGRPIATGTTSFQAGKVKKEDDEFDDFEEVE